MSVLGSTTLGRIAVAVAVLWFVVGLVAAAFFASGGTTPPERDHGRVVKSPR